MVSVFRFLGRTVRMEQWTTVLQDEGGSRRGPITSTLLGSTTRHPTRTLDPPSKILLVQVRVGVRSSRVSPTAPAPPPTRPSTLTSFNLYVALPPPFPFWRAEGELRMFPDFERVSIIKIWV